MSYCLSLSAYCSHCTISSITSSTDHLTWRRCRLRFFSATCPSLSQTRISIATNATLFRPTFANKYHGMFQAYLGAFTTLATPNLGFFIFKPYRSLLSIPTSTVSWPTYFCRPATFTDLVFRTSVPTQATRLPHYTPRHSNTPFMAPFHQPQQRITCAALMIPTPAQLSHQSSPYSALVTYH